MLCRKFLKKIQRASLSASRTLRGTTSALQCIPRVASFSTDRIAPNEKAKDLITQNDPVPLPMEIEPPSKPFSQVYTSEKPRPPEPSIDEVRFKLLKKALELVPQYSFTQKAIDEAAKELNFPITLAALVPNGPKDLIEFLLDQGIRAIFEAHQELISTSDAESKPGMTKKVTHLTRKRLEFMKPYIHQWPYALRIMAYPTNTLFSLNQLHRIADEIWHLAGDQAFDINYYTKRALLASVYSSSELYMTRDTSVDFHKTFDFMNARFQNTKQIGDLIKSARESCNWGVRNILGIFNSR